MSKGWPRIVRPGLVPCSRQHLRDLALGELPLAETSAAQHVDDGQAVVEGGVLRGRLGRGRVKRLERLPERRAVGRLPDGDEPGRREGVFRDGGGIRRRQAVRGNPCRTEEKDVADVVDEEFKGVAAQDASVGAEKRGLFEPLDRRVRFRRANARPIDS